MWILWIKKKTYFNLCFGSQNWAHSFVRLPNIQFTSISTEPTTHKQTKMERKWYSCWYCTHRRCLFYFILGWWCLTRICTLPLSIVPTKQNITCRFRIADTIWLSFDGIIYFLSLFVCRGGGRGFVCMWLYVMLKATKNCERNISCSYTWGTLMIKYISPLPIRIKWAHLHIQFSWDGNYSDYQYSLVFVSCRRLGVFFIVVERRYIELIPHTRKW